MTWDMERGKDKTWQTVRLKDFNWVAPIVLMNNLMRRKI